jgi:hypothetical protein
LYACMCVCVRVHVSTHCPCASTSEDRHAGNANPGYLTVLQSYGQAELQKHPAGRLRARCPTPRSSIRAGCLTRRCQPGRSSPQRTRQNTRVILGGSL